MGEYSNYKNVKALKQNPPTIVGGFMKLNGGVMCTSPGLRLGLPLAGRNIVVLSLFGNWKLRISNFCGCLSPPCLRSNEANTVAGGHCTA